jgi:hypothetical protein
MHYLNPESATGFSGTFEMDEIDWVLQKDELTKGYDVKQLLTISRGDEGFVRSLLKMFVVQTPIFLDKMIEYFSSGNYTDMGETAHQLKQSIYALRIHAIKKPVLHIVNAGRANRSCGLTLAYLQKLKDFTLEIVNEIKEDYKL